MPKSGPGGCWVWVAERGTGGGFGDPVPATGGTGRGEKGGFLRSARNEKGDGLLLYRYPSARAGSKVRKTGQSVTGSS